MVETHDLAFWISQVLMQSFKDEAYSYSIGSTYKHEGVDGNIRMDIQVGGKKFRVLIFEPTD